MCEKSQAAITTKNDDDKCKIKRVVVTLYGTRPKMRIFKGAVMWAQQAEGEFVSDLILSNETGLQCWLHEVEEEAIEKRLPEEKG